MYEYLGTKLPIIGVDLAPKKVSFRGARLSAPSKWKPKVSSSALLLLNSDMLYKFGRNPTYFYNLRSTVLDIGILPNKSAILSDIGYVLYDLRSDECMLLANALLVP